MYAASFQGRNHTQEGFRDEVLPEKVVVMCSSRNDIVIVIIKTKEGTIKLFAVPLNHIPVAMTSLCQILENPNLKPFEGKKVSDVLKNLQNDTNQSERLFKMNHVLYFSKKEFETFNKKENGNILFYNQINYSKLVIDFKKSTQQRYDFFDSLKCFTFNKKSVLRELINFNGKVSKRSIQHMAKDIQEFLNSPTISKIVTVH